MEITFFIIFFIILALILLVIRSIILKFFKKRIPIIVILIIVIILILIIPIVNLSVEIKTKINEGMVNTKYRKNDFFEFNEYELINEFEINRNKIDNELKNKIILLTGKIEFKIIPKSYKPIRDVSYLRFGNIFENTIFIKCFFNDEAVYEHNIGDIITIVGKYRGFKILGFDNKERVEINIGDCIVVSTN